MVRSESQMVGMKSHVAEAQRGRFAMEVPQASVEISHQSEAGKLVSPRNARRRDRDKTTAPNAAVRNMNSRRTCRGCGWCKLHGNGSSEMLVVKRHIWKSRGTCTVHHLRTLATLVLPRTFCSLRRRVSDEEAAVDECAAEREPIEEAMQTSVLAFDTARQHPCPGTEEV